MLLCKSATNTDDAGGKLIVICIETTDNSRMIAPSKCRGEERVASGEEKSLPLATRDLPLKSGEVAEWSTNLSGTN